MLAILVVIGTKYACNLDHDRDHICLQSWFKRGPNLPAISVSIGTIYACNRICWGPYTCMPAILNFLNNYLTQDDPLQRVLKIFEIAGILGPYL